MPATERSWDAAFSGVRRAFWVHIGLCLAAAVLGFLPAKETLYSNAIEELNKLGTISVGSNGIERSLRAELEQDFGAKLRDLIKDAAESNDLNPEFPSTESAFSYFHVESGPYPIMFDTDIPNIISLAKWISSDEPYVVAVPDIEALRPEFDRVFSSVGPEFKNILSVQFSCDDVGERCQGYIEIDDNEPGVPFHILEPSAPRKLLTLEKAAFSVVRDMNPSVDSELLLLPNLSRVSNEIFDKTRAAAIADLERRRSESMQAITAFGLAFPGNVAHLVAPPLLASTGAFLFLSLNALKSLSPPPQAVSMAFVAPLFKGFEGQAIRVALLLAFPLVVDVSLALRGFSAGVMASAWIIGLLGVHLTVCALGYRTATKLANQPDKSEVTRRGEI